MLTVAGLFLLVHVFFATGEPPTERQSVPCNKNGAELAAQAAFQHISALHHHGYKYQLKNSSSRQLINMGGHTCEFHLELDLEETTCHVVNPKPVEECVVRETHETKVESNCNVTLTVAEENATVKKYSCSSGPASPEKLHRICPDCPSLLPLHYPAGLDSIKSALKKFHEETNETSYFKLLEVGRLSTQHILTGQNKNYFAEFAIVETDCSPQVTPSEVDKCKVLGRGKAHYGFCKSTLLGNGEVSVDCEIYDAQNLTDGRHHHHHHHRPHHRHHHHHLGGRHNSHLFHEDSQKHPRRFHPGWKHNGHPSCNSSHEHLGHPRPGGRHNGHPSQKDSHEHSGHPRPGGRHNSHPSQKDSHKHPSHPRPGGRRYGHPSHNSSHEHPHWPHNLPPFFSGSSEHPHPNTELHHCRGQVKIPPSIHPICPHPIWHKPLVPVENCHPHTLGPQSRNHFEPGPSTIPDV